MIQRRMILALTASLALLAAGAAVAKDRQVVKIAAGDDDAERKVEVVERDGKTHVKIWKIDDGKETLVEEYDLAKDDERVLKLDGDRVIVIGDDGDVMFHGDGDLHFMDDEDLTGDDDDFTWVAADRTYLGVQLSDLDKAQTDYFEVKDGKGALVTEVVEDSPAAKAGFQIYDVIREIDGQEIDDSGEAVKTVRDHEKGDEIEVVVLRRGKTKKLQATLDERAYEDLAGIFDGRAPKALGRLRDYRQFFPSGKVRSGRLTPLPRADHDEIENLRADIEELRAMLEELKAERK